MQAYLLYEVPEYKTQIGNFRSRLEAERFLQQIIQLFPGSFVVATQIEFPKLEWSLLKYAIKKGRSNWDGLFCIHLNLLQGLFHFYFFVSFDDIAFSDVVVVLDIQTTFEAFLHFFNIVFKALQGSKLASVNYHTIAD